MERDKVWRDDTISRCTGETLEMITVGTSCMETRWVLAVWRHGRRNALISGQVKFQKMGGVGVLPQKDLVLWGVVLMTFGQNKLDSWLCHGEVVWACLDPLWIVLPMTVAAIPTVNSRDRRHRRSPQNPAQNWHLRHEQLYQVFCSSVSKLTRIDYKPSNKHYYPLVLHAAAARTSTHVFIIMVTPTSFSQKSGPVKTGPTWLAPTPMRQANRNNIHYPLWMEWMEADWCRHTDR